MEVEFLSISSGTCNGSAGGDSLNSKGLTLRPTLFGDELFTAELSPIIAQSETQALDNQLYEPCEFKMQAGLA
jgi:hypothetical protein